VDLSSVPIEWLNNLSSDSRYSNLPKKLSALTEPSYNGYPTATAHNVVNIVMVANAASAAAIYYAALMPMLVKRNVPARFGAVFYTDSVVQVILLSIANQISSLILTLLPLQASSSLHSALADPPYNVPSSEEPTSSAVASDAAYVDQSTAFALAFACVKQR
jgi:hypothetical protein